MKTTKIEWTDKTWNPITFFFKQWGTWGSDGIKRGKHENGKLLKGKVWQAMPA